MLISDRNVRKVSMLLRRPALLQNLPFGKILLSSSLTQCLQLLSAESAHVSTNSTGGTSLNDPVSAPFAMYQRQQVQRDWMWG